MSFVPVARLVERSRRDVVRGLVGATVLVVVVGVLGLVLAVGNPFTWAADQLGGSGEVVNDPGRLGSLETNNRTVWWGEAWQVFRAHPAGGTGAWTFEIARKRYRDDAENVSEPHSVPMQLLSDGGLPAFVLGLALVAALVLGLRATIRRLGPKSEQPRPRCSRSRSRSGCTRSSTTTSTSSPSPRRPRSSPRRCSGPGRPQVRRRTLPAVAAVAAAVVAICLLVAPALSARAVDRAYRQADAGELEAAARLRPPRAEPEPALT